MKFFDIKYRLNDGLHKQPRLKAAAALIGGLLAINAVAYGVTSLSNDHNYSLHKADHKTLTVKSPGKTASAGGGSSSGSGASAPSAAGGGGSAQFIQGGGSQFAGSSPAGGSGGYTSSPPATTTLVGGMGGGSGTTTGTGGTSGGSTGGSGGGSTCLCSTITGVTDTTQQTLTQIISPLAN
jgi:hypothetical protein